jgi:hypothetical protein
MPEGAPPTNLILLSTAVGLLVLLLLVSWGIARRLARIDLKLADLSVRMDGESSAPTVSETSPGGAFESFLSEDASRRSLPKAEQFAAYRRWRQEKGLNWSNS